jgi:RNA polymerase sigma factor (sigma-70 family)
MADFLSPGNFPFRLMSNVMTTQNMPDTGLPDAALVAASLAGDREAFGLIVARYQSLVCSLAFSATGSLTQSEDLAQETFVSAWKTLPALREPASLRPWLCRIARNRICDLFRGEKREPSHAAEPLEHADQTPALEPLPPDYAISREEEAMLWRAIERIPESYREPLVLFYREGQSIKSVAQNLELSEDAVKQRLARGRKMLTEQVLAFVEGALKKTSPGKLFTFGVLASLPLAATSANAAVLGSSMAVAGTAAKSAATAGSACGFFPPVVGMLGLYHTFQSEIEETGSPRERQLMIRMVWIRVVFLIVSLALLYFCMRTVDAMRHPLVFETAMAAFIFGAALFMVVLFGYFDRRRRQIEADGTCPAETGKSGEAPASPLRKASKRNVYVAAAAGTAFPLAWLLVAAVRAFRTGLWVTGLLTLLVGGMGFFLAVRSWKRRPQQFINLDFGKMVQIVALCGLMTLVQYNLGRYFRGIVAIGRNSMETVVTGRGAVVAFNAVIVLVYAAFIGILVWRRRRELRPGSRR